MPISKDEQELRRYLLGLGTPEEQDRVEETFLATSEHAELVGDAEHRLVSDYIQRRLPEEEEQAFERHYLVTGERHEQVAIARAAAAIAAVDCAAAPQAGIWRRFLDWVGAPGPVVGLAGALATAVLLIANVALLLRRPEPTQYAGPQQTRALSLPKGIAPDPSPSRVFGIPVVRIEATDLSGGKPRKLSFRLPAAAPDTVAIPLDLAGVDQSAVVDAVLSAGDQETWAQRPVSLKRSGNGVQADLLVSFSAVRPHLGRAMTLAIIERGHATLAEVSLIFESAGSKRTGQPGE